MAYDKVDVSVIIPSFNAANTIAAALTSALSQTLTNIEVLVVDDGSTDGSRAVVESFASQDSRLRLLTQPNAGVGAARNTGIRNARGVYIAPLDADDTWVCEKLERQVTRMEECGSKCGLVYCRSNLIDANDRWLRAEPLCNLEGKLRTALILKNFVGNASVPLFRSTALHSIGPYLERSEQDGAQGCEDWDLSIRMAERFEIGAVCEHLVNYRQMHSCMTLRYNDMSKSYAVLRRRARARNADLPSAIYRRSAGNFYSYLATNCYRWSNYTGCIACALRAMLANPRVMISYSLCKLLVKSIFRSGAERFRRDASQCGMRVSSSSAREVVHCTRE